MQQHTPVTSRGFTLIVRWTIVLALWVLLISMATGQFGISNYMELVRNRDALERINLQLSVDNQILEETIARMRTSRDAQLRYLKDNFGYVEKGEFVYHFGRGPIPEFKAKRPKVREAAAEQARKKRI